VAQENSVPEMNNGSTIDKNPRHLIDFWLFKDLPTAAGVYIVELDEKMYMKSEWIFKWRLGKKSRNVRISTVS
jgi:hypothetical protein